MQSILITGVAGFIGSHLAEYFLNHTNYKVIGIDNFDVFYDPIIKKNNLLFCNSHVRFKFYEMDLCQQIDIDKITEKIECVIHLAAKAGVRPSIHNPLSYIQHNIVVTQNVLLWMKKNGVNKMIFASSSSVYGNNKKVPFCESDNVDNPISPYAFSKKSCELLNYTFHHLYQMSIINLRLFTVYGPRQRPDLAIHKFANQIINEDLIEVYGDGSTSRDYTYVTDTVQGIFAAFEHVQQSSQPVYNIINLGNQYPIKLIDLIRFIEDALQQKARIIHKPMQEGDVDITYANIEKAKNILKYKPIISLEEGIQKFKAWKTKII